MPFSGEHYEFSGDRHMSWIKSLILDQLKVFQIECLFQTKQVLSVEALNAGNHARVGMHGKRFGYRRHVAK